MRYAAKWKGISSKMQNQRSLLAQFLRFSSATVASLMVFSLYSIVDGLFVAKGVGDYAMAAVNLAVPFTNVMFSIAVTSPSAPAPSSPSIWGRATGNTPTACSPRIWCCW